MVDETKPKVTIVFLYSSPAVLLDYDKDEKVRAQVLAALNFMNEARNIKNAIKKSGLNISFKSRVATRKSLTDTLIEGPTILHISCHGFNVEEQHVERGKYLIFEDEYGVADIISLREVKKLVHE